MANQNSAAERKLLAVERLAARKRQVVLIRKWVAGIAVSIFIALWVVLFVQLVSGHDPALAHGSSPKTASAQSTTSNQTANQGSNQTSNRTTNQSSNQSSNQTSSSSGSSSGTSPITTSQS
jgi:cytoskeletal protein RodZ